MSSGDKPNEKTVFNDAPARLSLLTPDSTTEEGSSEATARQALEHWGTGARRCAEQEEPVKYYQCLCHLSVPFTKFSDGQSCPQVADVTNHSNMRNCTISQIWLFGRKEQRGVRLQAATQ